MTKNVWLIARINIKRVLILLFRFLLYKSDTMRKSRADSINGNAIAYIQGSQFSVRNLNHWLYENETLNVIRDVVIPLKKREDILKIYFQGGESST